MLRFAGAIGRAIGFAAAILITQLMPAGAVATKLTIVLVPGARADSSSWNGVIAQLPKRWLHGRRAAECVPKYYGAAFSSAEPADVSATMAATQRPITSSAVNAGGDHASMIAHPEVTIRAIVAAAQATVK